MLLTVNDLHEKKMSVRKKNALTQITYSVPLGDRDGFACEHHPRDERQPAKRFRNCSEKWNVRMSYETLLIHSRQLTVSGWRCRTLSSGCNRRARGTTLPSVPKETSLRRNSRMPSRRSSQGYRLQRCTAALPLSVGGARGNILSGWRLWIPAKRKETAMEELQ